MLRYKAVSPNHIAVLELYEDSNTNEHRPVLDSYRARYRTDKAKVVDIIDIETNKSANVIAYSWYMPGFTYEIGKVVTAILESPLEETCGTGIHYFKNYESAASYCLENKCLHKISLFTSTPMQVWDLDGKPTFKLVRKDNYVDMIK